MFARARVIQREGIRYTARAFDAVLISTAHDAFDWDAIAKHSRLIIDTRNAMKGHEESLGDRLVKA